MRGRERPGATRAAKVRTLKEGRDRKIAASLVAAKFEIAANSD